MSLRENRITIKQWVEKFNLGEFESRDVKIQINAGWYDWFCKDTSLANKTKTMGQVIKQLKPNGKVDLDKSFIWFKNNCPLNHPLYDDFRIAKIENGETEYIVQTNSPWETKKYTVYGVIDFFNQPVFETDSRRELVKWFNNELVITK